MEKVTCEQDLDRPILNSSPWNWKVSSGLRSIAVVIPQHTTEPVAASDLAIPQGKDIRPKVLFCEIAVDLHDGRLEFNRAEC